MKPTSATDSKVLVIIPAHNEEASIGKVIDEIRSSKPGVDILVVDDASDDNTARVAREMQVDVASLSINLGIGGAAQTGFQVAKQLGYDTITDCSSGFRALNIRALDLFAESYPVDFPDAEALIMAHRAGLRVLEVPARFRERHNGRSSLRPWRMLYYPLKETLSIGIMMTKRGGCPSE